MGVAGEVGPLQHRRAAGVRRTQAAEENLADRVDTRHRRPVQEVAAPVAAHPGTVMVVGARGCVLWREQATGIGVTTLAVEIAVVIERVGVGVIDNAVLVQIRVIRKGLLEQRMVGRHREHDHRAGL